MYVLCMPPKFAFPGVPVLFEMYLDPVSILLHAYYLICNQSDDEEDITLQSFGHALIM